MRLISLIFTLLAAGAATSVQAQGSGVAQSVPGLDVSNWAPVNIPAGHVRVHIPCDDADLAAFNKAHKLPSGIVACERPEYIAHVIYAVNTRPGFFDDISVGDGKTALQHSVAVFDHHRIYKSHETDEGHDSVMQLVELNSTSSLMMLLRSKTASAQKFAYVARQFIGSLEFTDQ